MPKSTVSLSLYTYPLAHLSLAVGTHTRSIAMDCSNDWDLQALVRSCGGGNRSVQHSRAGADAPPREEAAMVRGGGRAAAQLELLGQPVGAVSSWRRGLDHLDDLVDRDREPRRMPFSVSVTPSSSRETTATCGLMARAGQQLRHDDVLFSFAAAAAAGVVSRSGHQMVQPRRRQPGRKAGGRTTPRPKRRYGRCSAVQTTAFRFDPSQL